MIRKGTREDSEAITNCLLQAMNEIVYSLIGEQDSGKAKEFMQHFVERKANQYSYQNCWVVEVNQEIVAAVNVYNGADLHRLREPVLAYLRSCFKRTLIPEDETGAGEYYIDSLGVIPDYQGIGIGSQVLQFLIDKYVTENGKTLGLLVDEENVQAKRLYLRLGFTFAGEKTLLEKRMIHLQVKR
ncbi:MAG TPA: GNAT family N-acetyltransferase [Flavisolibacter sp.]|jgi:ribosomal protein S18 acetylase RimI-like enzyme|nr:GNAT family N-acetyltransferase [Flavisolibacter sp.]